MPPRSMLDFTHDPEEREHTFGDDMRNALDATVGAAAGGLDAILAHDEEATDNYYDRQR